MRTDRDTGGGIRSVFQFVSYVVHVRGGVCVQVIWPTRSAAGQVRCVMCVIVSMLYVGDKSSSGAVAVGDEIGIQLLSNVLGMTCETAMEMMCVMESGACDLGSICLSITIY